MKVLVSGASGLVGKETINALKKAHYQVIPYDRHNKKDILNEEQLFNEVKKADAVIHLAGIIESNNPNLFEVNVKGTQNIINAALKARIKKLIFISTTGVYGWNTKKIDENTPISPENDYEKSKAEGEKIVFNAKDQLNVCVIRSAMIFGANEYWEKMFNLLKKKYPLPCNGNNTFQIIYSKELARAIIQVLKKGKCGEIYLASGKEKRTLNEFCEMTQKELNLQVGIKHIPSSIGIILGKILGMKLLTKENIRHLSKERNYNIKKLEKLGYKQKTDLKKAIKEVVKEFDKISD